MSPFIMSKKRKGKYFLPFQIEIYIRDKGNVFDLIKNKRVCELLMPKGHSLSCSWLCALNFEDQVFFTFSASSTGVDGWIEVGTLNISVSDSIDMDSPAWMTADHFCLKNFGVLEVFKMTIEEPSFYSECGLKIVSDDGSIFSITTGIAPGSLSVALPYKENFFESEFPLDDYLLIQV